jgi:hypothetical protein
MDLREEEGIRERGAVLPVRMTNSWQGERGINYIIGA